MSAPPPTSGERFEGSGSTEPDPSSIPHWPLRPSLDTAPYRYDIAYEESDDDG